MDLSSPKVSLTEILNELGSCCAGARPAATAHRRRGRSDVPRATSAPNRAWPSQMCAACPAAPPAPSSVRTPYNVLVAVADGLSLNVPRVELLSFGSTILSAVQVSGRKLFPSTPEQKRCRKGYSCPKQSMAPRKRAALAPHSHYSVAPQAPPTPSPPSASLSSSASLRSCCCPLSQCCLVHCAGAQPATTAPQRRSRNSAPRGFSAPSRAWPPANVRRSPPAQQGPPTPPFPTTSWSSSSLPPSSCSPFISTSAASSTSSRVAPWPQGNTRSSIWSGLSSYGCRKPTGRIPAEAASLSSLLSGLTSVGWA